MPKILPAHGALAGAGAARPRRPSGKCSCCRKRSVKTVGRFRRRRLSSNILAGKSLYSQKFCAKLVFGEPFMANAKGEVRQNERLFKKLIPRRSLAHSNQSSFFLSFSLSLS